MSTKVKIMNLKKVMKARKITVPELAERTGLSRNTIFCYLGGRVKTPSIKNLRLMARALDCSVGYLIDE